MKDPFMMPEAEDDFDRKLLSDIDEYGWHIVGIDADDEGPQYVFTVGFFHSFDHLEVLIMGLDREVSCQFLHMMAVAIQNGTRYVDGYMDTELASFPTVFRTIPLTHYEGYLGYAIWFYRSLPRPFPAVQFLWPDKQGLFPWEAEYDARFLALQRPLYE